MTQKTETTGVLIIHNDSSLLAKTLNSARTLVDRLVVVDGAYDWVAPFCKMNGEEEDRSSDDLLKILDDFGMPYTYHTGVWQNETHKRQASLEFVETDRVMLIDSDEIYNVEQATLQAFWESGKVMGSLEAPLFLHDNVVTWHKAAKAYPLKPVFLNMAGQDVETVVASLWLLLPDSEKGKIVDRSLIERKPLGMFYHLSMLRTQNNPYRRSRFYNLLSMRVGKRIGLDVNKDFSSDAEFTELVKQSNRVALDNMFNFHRLAAGFPQKKDNQDLVTIDIENPEHKAVVEEAYADMLADQKARAEALFGQRVEVFNGRGIFLDLTAFADGTHKGLKINHDDGTRLRVKWHIDCGTERFEIAAETGDFPDLSQYEGMKRLLIEIALHGQGTDTVSLDFDLE